MVEPPTPHGTVHATTVGPVATIVLDRPAKRNAMSYTMWCDLEQVCRQLDADPSVRAVVLRGAGGHFCAGADVTELLAEPVEGRPTFIEADLAAEEALATLRTPTVAAVRGDCIGGGAALAIDCDIRIAAADARFGITPVRLGVVYPPASLERVARLLGPSARRLLLTGELVGADEALRLGLVDEVVATADLDARIDELSTVLVERSSLAQMALKEMLAAVFEHGSVPAPLAATWAEQANSSGETAEGVAAFLARRPPNFPWRRRALRS